jgi:hypothetical protein
MFQETDLEAAVPAGAPAPRKSTVLVVGTYDWAIGQAAAELKADGERVLRCHQPGEPSSPCNAMIEGRVCPLDVGFEVVADVRSRAAAGLTQSELGVICGARLGRPLMVAGLGIELPLQRWFGRAVPAGGNLVTICEEVAAGRGGGMISTPALERSQSI